MRKSPLARAFVVEPEMAEWTGLEPATPGVTGRYSNQLNYHSGFLQRPGKYGACRLKLETAGTALHYTRRPQRMEAKERTYAPC